MSRYKNTDYAANESASDYHRIMGKCCYYSDLDNVDSTQGSENMFIDYTYQDGQEKPVAIFDWKYPGNSISTKYSGIKIQKIVADQLQVPFFIAITYLDKNFPVKCYYVIPVNQYAKDYFRRCRLNHTGDWFSLRNFSKFQHALRGKQWNEHEVISPDNCEAVGLPVGTTLGQLSNEKKAYKLPLIEMI